jgi:hypothetical protein
MECKKGGNQMIFDSVILQGFLNRIHNDLLDQKLILERMRLQIKRDEDEYEVLKAEANEILKGGRC